MVLTEQDLKEHYYAMKNEPFFEEDLQDIEQFYNAFLDKYFPDDAAKQAVCFEYHDERDLILMSDPDRTRIVLAIFVFLEKYKYPLSFMTIEMQDDLKGVVAERKVEKYIDYYYPSDFVLMKRAAESARRRIKSWS